MKNMKPKGQLNTPNFWESEMGKHSGAQWGGGSL